MKLDFRTLAEIAAESMNGGKGTVFAKMYADADERIIVSRLPAGASIGMHAHPHGDDINFVLSGSGTALCDGAEEELRPGCCHICKKGSSHSITNTGGEDLVLFTVVAAR